MCEQPLVISFYTENTPYQFEVMALLNSCKEHGIELEVDAVPSAGSWEKNCAKKPTFIRDKLLEKKRPLFWVDADAMFCQPPDFTPFFPFDFSVYEVPDRKQDRFFRYRAGSIFINYTERGIQFADAWVEWCKQVMQEGKNLSFLDQTSLFDLLPYKELRLTPLPLAYCKVMGLDDLLMEKESVVIEHRQASLRIKQLV